MITRSSLFAAVSLVTMTASVSGQPAKTAFREKDRIVFTYNFIWYHAPGKEHIVTDKGVDYLSVHPKPYVKSFDKNLDYRKRGMPQLTADVPFTYTSPAYHNFELGRMAAAEIDVVAVDFWAYPNEDVAPRNRLGVEKMNEAMNALSREGVVFPAACLFLESNPLGKPGGQRTDLRTEAGGDNLFKAVDAFYSRLDRKYWATVDGRALVILYASDIEGEDKLRDADKSLIVGKKGLRVCRDKFKEKYKIDLAFVGNSGWRAKGGDEVRYSCAWTACGREDRLIEGTDLMQISPGYNYLGKTKIGKVDTPPDPAKYKAAWESARKQPRNWIAIETMNEYHEGTAITPTIEGGEKLLKITAEQAALFKKRK
jgi:hypothetical protein